LLFYYFGLVNRTLPLLWLRSLAVYHHFAREGLLHLLRAMLRRGPGFVLFALGIGAEEVGHSSTYGIVVIIISESKRSFRENLKP